MDWVRPESSVPFRSEIGEPLSRFSYARHIVGAPCLEQQHGGVATLRQAASNDRTGRARSANDKIIGWLKLCREPALIGLNAGVEFDCFQSDSRIASWVRLQVNYSGPFPRPTAVT